MEWDLIEFKKALVKHSIGKKNQIKTSEFKSEGKYPVIDQSENLISGYSDDMEKVIDNDLPYIIFGDHTRVFKYIDFPFILGADGTKVLKVNDEKIDPKFFYFSLLNLNIENRGYNRHYTLLQEKKIPVPKCKSEQQKIASILSTIQKGIALEDQLINILQELKKAMMRKIFTEGIRDELQKQTESSLPPNSWDLIEFKKALVKHSIGKKNQIKTSEFKTEGKYPVIDQGKSLISGYSDDMEKAIDNDLPYIIFGDHTRVFKYIDFPFILGADGTKVLKVNDEKIDPKFFYFSLLNLNIENRGYNRHYTLLQEKKIPVPKCKSEQQEIAKLLSVFDDRIDILNSKKKLLKELFNTLLHKLMTAEIRVNELDLSDLELTHDPK